ncbi:F-box only protein 6-like [Mya arenaria]|uniref:F-box only protein 6-like n=1 Tax=Mya arenaria TaxID=6604 RepID=UPI0022E519A7|nr:F-box only protein 6-like [Mya arenaria]
MGRKNLLENNRAKDGISGWEVTAAGGDGFCCEDEISGCKDICECTSVKGSCGYWCTSHDPCEKRQLVDLLDKGISDTKLDGKKPPITVRDWYCSRGDCGCEYWVKVRLLGEDRETELDAWEFKDTLEEGADWKKSRHVFKGYPDGVRFVEFSHGGNDSHNREGHYGVKMTNSAVFVGKKRSNKKKRVRGTRTRLDIH